MMQMPPHMPFDARKPLDLADLRSALTDIRGDIEAVIDGIDKADLSRSQNDHMRVIMAMSGLEIKMTNFAVDMRRKFLA